MLLLLGCVALFLHVDVLFLLLTVVGLYSRVRFESTGKDVALKMMRGSSQVYPLVRK